MTAGLVAKSLCPSPPVFSGVRSIVSSFLDMIFFLPDAPALSADPTSDRPTATANLRHQLCFRLEALRAISLPFA